VLVECGKPDQLFDEIVTVIEQGHGHTHRLWRLDEIERVALFPVALP
jgi:hypothetical protein